MVSVDIWVNIVLSKAWISVSYEMIGLTELKKLAFICQEKNRAMLCKSAIPCFLSLDIFVVNTCVLVCTDIQSRKLILALNLVCISRLLKP